MKESSSPVSISANHNNNNAEIRELLMDIHEPIDICEKLRQKGVPVKVQHLESGDYVFSNIGIERKTLTDFWGSLTTKEKRIWKQMFELKRHYERPFLVIEKFNFQYLRSPEYSRQIWGAISSIALMGVNVITIVSKSGGSEELIDFMSYLYFSSDKSKKSAKPLPEKSKTAKEVFMDTLCIPLDEQILTWQGLKNITDLKEGDKILDSSIEKISINPPTSEIYELKGSGLLPFKITGNHPVLVVTRKKKWEGKTPYWIFSKPYWKNVQDLINSKKGRKVSDLLVMPRIREEKEHLISFEEYNWKYSHNKTKLNSVAVDEEIAWLLGIYLAEGWTRETGIFFSLGKHEIEKVQKIKKILQKRFNLTSKIKETQTSLVLSSFSKQLQIELDRLMGKGARNKYIPEIIFKSKLACVKAFIEGYKDGDGCEYETDRKRISFGTASKGIALGLQLLLGKLGLWANVNQTYQICQLRKDSKKRSFYHITLAKEQNKIRSYFKEKEILIPIQKLEKCSTEEIVWNCRTKNHSFVFGNVITHNCMVPGIGPGSAEKLVSRYKTFDELGKVAVEDLSSLIGKSRVKMLWLILHGETI